MTPARLALLIVCLLAPTPASAADGAIYLYLQPLPPEAARLTFVLDSVAAVTASGTEHPLTLDLTNVGPKEVARQRLLASGRLPDGEYVGFVFRVTKAALRTDRGEAALMVPDTPARLDLPWSAARGEAQLVWLTLRYRDSVTEGIAFSPAFSTATPSLPVADHLGFVTSAAWNSIAVFDKRLAQVVAIVATCAGPSGMALDQLRRRLYVACSKDDEIQAIDIVALRLLQRVTVSPGDHPQELALTPDGSTLISVNAGSDSISFFDATSLMAQERIDVGNGPSSILMGPDGRRAFVFNRLSSSLSVIDIPSRTGSVTLSMDAPPLRGAFNDHGNALFVIHERSPFMTVVDARQLNLATRARLVAAVDAIAVDTVRGLLCLVGSRDTSVEFYDPNALLPLYAMPVPAGVSFVTIDARDSRLYMVNPNRRTLVVGRLADRAVASEIDVGPEAYQVAVMGER